MVANFSLPKLVVILGPTASGKTALSLALATQFNAEIISADSRQVYRGMDIGTAKEPNESTEAGTYIVQGVRHHLINIIDPDQEYTLALFQERANAAITEAHVRGHVPMLVGGTGLYISAVVDNFDIPRVPPNYELRKQLEALPTEQLFVQLEQQDAQTARMMDPFNRRYLIRALEIITATGKSVRGQKKRAQPRFDPLLIGVARERKDLYARINARVDEMMEKGLVEETRRLYEQYGPRLSSMTGIGYEEIIEYICGRLTREEAVERIKQRTRAFARRQLTWWRGDARVQWVSNFEEARSLVRAFLG